jgi:maleylacetoacetate isomerase
LEPFKVPTSAGKQDNPVPLEYLQDPDYSSYDIQLSVAIQSESMKEPYVVSRSNFANLYWNAAQQLVHHSVTGCIMKAGDLLGSGTISGTSEKSFGSMLELSWKGSRSVSLSKDGGGESRKFLQDGDTVIIKGFCSKPGHGKIGFGECRGKILPAGTNVNVPYSIRSEPMSTRTLCRFQNFTLYSLWRSSCTWRVRIALAAKNVPYKTVAVNLEACENKSDAFLEKNSLAQVPVLECTDSSTGKTHRLTQSVAIIEFLDRCFPAYKSLFPSDPMDRVVATEMIEVINSGIQPLQNRGILQLLEVTTKDKAAVNQFCQEAICNGLRAVQRLVERRKSKENPGPFAMGGFSPNVVDCFLIPQLYNARRYGLNVEEEFPALVAVEQVCSRHPWFGNTHPTAQPDAPKDVKSA